MKIIHPHSKTLKTPPDQEVVDEIAKQLKPFKVTEFILDGQTFYIDTDLKES